MKRIKVDHTILDYLSADRRYQNMRERLKKELNLKSILLIEEGIDKVQLRLEYNNSLVEIPNMGQNTTFVDFANHRVYLDFSISIEEDELG